MPPLILELSWKDSGMESTVGSSEANLIVVDDSSDDEEKPAKRSSETSSPSKQQGDKNRLLGQLHAERLARQARGDASCATSGDEQKPSALDTGPMKRVRGDLIEMALKGCFERHGGRYRFEHQEGISRSICGGLQNNPRRSEQTRDHLYGDGSPTWSRHNHCQCLHAV